MAFNKNEKKAYDKGYRITKEGKVIGIKGDSIGNYSQNGYLKFKIRDENGDNKTASAHRLQAYQKFGERIYVPGTVVRHLDGDQKNNHIDNIEIGTNRDNQLDISPEKRMERALHATSFVRKFDKEEVKKYHEESGSYMKTMEYFGISSKGTLHHILNK